MVRAKIVVTWLRFSLSRSPFYKRPGTNFLAPNFWSTLNAGLPSLIFKRWWKQYTEREYAKLVLIAELYFGYFTRYSSTDTQVSGVYFKLLRRQLNVVLILNNCMGKTLEPYFVLYQVIIRVCPFVDNKFCHNIVKVVHGSTQLSPHGSTATLTKLWLISWSIRGQTHDNLTSIG